MEQAKKRVELRKDKSASVYVTLIANKSLTKLPSFSGDWVITLPAPCVHKSEII